jgi:hypothetical protein
MIYDLFLVASDFVRSILKELISHGWNTTNVTGTESSDIDLNRITDSVFARKRMEERIANWKVDATSEKNDPGKLKITIK